MSFTIVVIGFYLRYLLSVVVESVHNLDRPYHWDGCYGGTGSMQCYSQTPPAIPYATATLVCGAPYHTVCGTGNIPNPQAYMIHQPNTKQGTDVKTDSSSSGTCKNSSSAKSRFLFQES